VGKLFDVIFSDLYSLFVSRYYISIEDSGIVTGQRKKTSTIVGDSLFIRISFVAPPGIEPEFKV
jgi:hypothetical protein